MLVQVLKQHDFINLQLLGFVWKKRRFYSGELSIDSKQKDLYIDNGYHKNQNVERVGFMKENLLMVEKRVEIPDIIFQQYDKLCELVETAKDGNLEPKSVAKYCGKDYQWLLDATCTGDVPFAFGTRTGKHRGCFRFGVLPIFCYEMQSPFFRPLWEEKLKQQKTGFTLL